MKTLLVISAFFSLFLVASCGKSPAPSANEDKVGQTFHLIAIGTDGGTPAQAKSACESNLDGQIRALPLKCSDSKRQSYLGQCPNGMAEAGQGWVSKVELDVTCP
jgi:hypothetical protein